MNKPLVSIIIPCYNSASYIEETLRSVISQTYSNIEIIIIDDGSTDNSKDIIDSFDDSRIKYFRQENKGQCAASNFGVSKSLGDYIKFFDADDVMNTEHVEEQLKRLDGSETAIASCAWGRFYDGNPSSAIFKPETVWKDMLPIDWLRESLSQKNDMMPAWLWLIPRKVWNKSGGWNESLSLNNDFEFSTRLVLNATEILFAPNAKVYYRSGISNALSASTNAKAFNDAYLSTYLGVAQLLKVDDSHFMKRICANRYQEWIYRMYPFHKEIIKKMEVHIKELGGSDRKMDGGKIFQLLNSVVDWKMTKLIRMKLQKLGYKKLPF